MNGENLVFDNARICFRNFAGQESKYNRAGARNFSVIIPSKEAAVALYNDGWNVAVKPQTQEDKEAIKMGKNLIEKIAILEANGSADDALYHLKCNVNMESKKPPKIYIVAGKKKRPIQQTVDTIAQIDVLDIAYCDIVIHPYVWENPMGSGVTAYLDTMYVVINADPFADKYAMDDEEEEYYN